MSGSPAPVYRPSTLRRSIVAISAVSLATLGLLIGLPWGPRPSAPPLADPEVSFSATSLVVFEFAPNVAIPVQLSFAAPADVTIPFTVSGSASQPGDYSISASPLVIPAGSSSGAIVVTLVDDEIPEPTKTVTIALGTPQGAKLGAPAAFVLKIRDDDGPFDRSAGLQPISPALKLFPSWLEFGVTRVGELSQPLNIVVLNDSDKPLSLTKAQVATLNAADFALTTPGSMPLVLAPSHSAVLEVVFAPTAKGPRKSALLMRQRPATHKQLRVDLTGQGLGPLGAEVLVNVGGDAFTSAAGEDFTFDHGYGPGSVTIATPQQVVGATDQDLYRVARHGPELHYAFAVPNGPYEVVLHFAEITMTPPGSRVFDVVVEGVTRIEDLDIAATVGLHKALVERLEVEVSDGRLDLDLYGQGLAGNYHGPLLCGFEIRSAGALTATPAQLDFGIVDEGGNQSLDLTLANPGLAPTVIETLRIANVEGDGRDVTVELDGQLYAGDLFDSVHLPQTVVPAGGSLVARVTFAPAQHATNQLELRFEGAFGVALVDVMAISGFAGDPYMHPVIHVADVAVDYDGSGSADVLLDGSDSHTHEPGHALTAWEWRANGALISTQEVDVVSLPLGPHLVELTIRDDSVPPRSLATTSGFEVVPKHAVPGVLALFHPAPVPGGAANLLAAPPANPEHAETLPGFALGAKDGGVEASGLTGDVMVELVAALEVTQAQSHTFAVVGGAAHVLELDGNPVTGPVTPSLGSHVLRLGVAIDTLADLPVELLIAQGGGPPSSFPPGTLVHDLDTTPPVIGSMPANGTTLGGNQIVISGFGFYPRSDVTVHWGATQIGASDLVAWSAERLEFVSPPGSGAIDVTVQTPMGTSNARTFTYQQDGPVPIKFSASGHVAMTQPTAGAWGPDGRFYVVTRPGTLKAITFGDDYAVLGIDTFPGVSQLANHEAMGLAFDPFDSLASGQPVRVWVAHSEMYAQGGGSFSGPSPYTGQVSYLEGPHFDTPVPVITNLPTSNHDHGINGLEFDNRGDLLIAVGGNTNAGVTHPAIGDLPESPLAAAILKAELSRPDFNGHLHYVESANGAPNDDQVHGDIVDLAPGTHVGVHASGLRNVFDLALTVEGRLYAADNGPNYTFGVASTSATTQTTWHPNDADELLLIEYGGYYGHPNRNRGRNDPIQNVYFKSSAPSQPGFTGALKTVPSSVNGLVEYRATTFGNQLRGDLIGQKWGAHLRWADLAADGLSVVAESALSLVTGGLGVETGPGGALLVIDYLSNRVRKYVPDDLAASGVTAYEITPWRAPRTGGTAFAIGGTGFGPHAGTQVRIGNINCFLTSVSATRIRGIVPANSQMFWEPVDVTVVSNGQTRVLPRAFRWLDVAPGLEPGRWETAPQMPLAAGEVACGAIGGRLYLVGEGNDRTYAYDPLAKAWSTTAAKRPFVGNHHGAEVVGGKWYLIGGLGAGGGKLQVYDPNADAWSLGTDMPWAGGSVSTAAIDGKIYAAGGIVGATTVDHAAVYDPSTNVWTPLTPMPTGRGRNHAAAGTDGERFWVFGGRGVGSGDGNWVANGFSDVQVYDPATDTWSASFDPGSTLAPLPFGRGGTGKAAWYQGEFYVFGGETLTGPGAVAGNVYARVDAYDPIANTWRTERPLPTPRHGIFPLVHAGRIWVAGGGTVAGFSASKACEVFSRQ